VTHVGYGDDAPYRKTPIANQVAPSQEERRNRNELPTYRSRFLRPESFAHLTACLHSSLVSGRAISG
jgi:hypothetical protein